MQVTVWQRAPQRSENFLGCIHKRGLKAKTAELQKALMGLELENIPGAIKRQLSASPGCMFFEDAWSWIKKMFFPSNMVL